MPLNKETNPKQIMQININNSSHCSFSPKYDKHLNKPNISVRELFGCLFLFYGVSTLSGSFKAQLSNSDKDFLKFSLV